MATKFGTKLAITRIVGGVVGSANVCNLWQKHFKTLYCQNVNSTYKPKFFDRLRELDMNLSAPSFDVDDVIRAVFKPVSYTHLTLPTNREV